ncbi:MAG: transcriptional repressor LexA [Proteobacteria bacterium]|nr:MAG: transcriptional repressor LexA [Pseudomonadota bacterium]
MTPKQKQVLEFIEQYRERQGYFPTRREIALGLGLSSVSTVQQHIEALEKKGCLQRPKDREARSVEILVPETQARGEIPVLGRVAAGFPIETFTQDRRIAIPGWMTPKSLKNLYALEVQGNSMRDEAILDGDVILVDRRSQARNGEIVVALLNGQATLKTLFKSEHALELHPANPEFPVIQVGSEDRFEIQGVLLGVLRSFMNRTAFPRETSHA